MDNGTILQAQGASPWQGLEGKERVFVFLNDDAFFCHGAFQSFVLVHRLVIARVPTIVGFGKNTSVPT